MNLLQNYKSPTPVKIRLFADSVLAASALAQASPILNIHPHVGVAVMVISVLFKFVSSFYTDSDK